MSAIDTSRKMLRLLYGCLLLFVTGFDLGTIRFLGNTAKHRLRFYNMGLVSQKKVCGMLEYIGYSSAFGSYEAKVRSEMECAAMCYRDIKCKAADYDRSAGFCRKHFSLGHRKRDSNSIRYEKSCSLGGCKDEFVKFKKVRAGGGTPVIEAKSEQSCRSACLAKTTCYRFDFLEKPQPLCEIFDERLLLTVNSNVLYDVYVRVKCFIPKGVMIITESDHTTTPRPGPPTTPPIICGMYEYVGFFSEGVINRTHFPHAMDCAKWCIDIQECVAVDYNFKQHVCSMHTGQHGKIPSSCCVQYIKTCQTGGCAQKFEKIPNRKGTGGQVIEQAITVKKCQDVCLMRSDCHGFDFDRVNTPRCQLYDIDFAGTMKRSTDVDAYVRVKCLTMPPACNADVIFLVDSSGSIKDAGKDNWDLVRRFVMDTTLALTRVPNANVRFAVVQFSTNADFRFDFSQYGTKYRQMLYHIQHMPYMGGRTNVTGGFRLVEKRLLGLGRGGNRPDAKDFLVLIADGESTVEREALDATAASVRAKGVDVVGVGVTAQVRRENMLKLLSDPSNFFAAKTFAQLNETVPKVVSLICPQ